MKLDSTPPPLNAHSIQSYGPVCGVACADAIAELVAYRTQRRRSPDLDLAVANKLTNCLSRSAAKLKDTPCEAIRLDYARCLEAEGRNSRAACHTLMVQLEGCAAKHVAKLS